MSMLSASCSNRFANQAGVKMTYIKQGTESVGDAGDQYTGLDRFGRVVDQRWVATATGGTADRYKYGYDGDGNRLYRQNLGPNASTLGLDELYHPNSFGGGYDLYNQMTAFYQGTLSPDLTTITPSRSLG